MTAPAVAVHERPILFSAEMVKAILAGTKSQTRRVVSDGNYRGNAKPSRCDLSRAFVDSGPSPAGNPGPYLKAPVVTPEDAGIVERIYPPYFVGDRLWVRETWAARGKHTDSYPPAEIACNRSHFEIWYREQCFDGAQEKFNTDFLGRWRPSIHMPRALSRITLEIADVRVERLQDISEADANAEGIRVADLAFGRGYSGGGETWHVSALEAFRELWDSINGDRASWSSNPFVWVISFKRVTP